MGVLLAGMCLLSASGAVGEPLTVVVPAHGRSEPVTVAGVTVRFEVENRSVLVRFEGWTPRQRELGWVSVDALTERGRYVTMSAEHEGSAKVVSVDLATTPVQHFLSWHHWNTSDFSSTIEVPIRRWPTATVAQLEAVVSLPRARGTATQRFSLVLQSPLTLGAQWAEVLRGANQLGPSFLAPSGGELHGVHTITGNCNDKSGSRYTLSVDFDGAPTLAIPEPGVRLLQLSNWLLITAIDTQVPLGGARLQREPLLDQFMIAQTGRVEWVGQRVSPGRAELFFKVHSCGAPEKIVAVSWTRSGFERREPVEPPQACE